MDMLLLFLCLWKMHSVTACTLAAPFVYFGRRRANWHPWELLSFVLPFSIWAGLMAADSSGKSLANMGECLNVSIAIGVAAAIRVLVGSRRWQRTLSLSLLVALCLVAVASYAFTPRLPE